MTYKGLIINLLLFLFISWLMAFISTIHIELAYWYAMVSFISGFIAICIITEIVRKMNILQFDSK